MYPELFRIGPLAISSYGLLLASAFVAGIYITLRLGRQRGIDEDALTNLAFLAMVSAIIGSRLLYVLTHLAEFRGRWRYTFLPVQPDGTIGLSGLIFLGGVIGALISGLIYAAYKKLPVWPTADSFAPAVAFGLFLGRMGCFLNGCCFGKACELPWGVKFPGGSPAGVIMGTVPLHPTQLYAAAYALLIFLFLLWLNRKKVFPGALSAAFLIGYGLSRFTVDFFRYYESEMQVGFLYLNQVISLVMIAGGAAVLVWRSTLSQKAAQAE